MAAKCKDCGYPVTWATQKAQFGRLIQAWLSEADAKQAMPRCAKCATKFKQEQPAKEGTTDGE